MTIYKIQIDNGPEITIDAALATDDDMLKAALSATMPEIANAEITRMPEQDGVVVIKLVKRAAPKGNDPAKLLETLRDIPEGENPVIALARELKDKKLEDYNAYERILLDARVCRTIDEGDEQKSVVNQRAETLSNAKARPRVDPVTTL